MSEDEFYDKLRGRKYVYLVTTGNGTSNANVLAHNEHHARLLGKERWSGKHEIKQCDEVTESFKNLNSSLSEEDIETLMPGILTIRFLGNSHEWITR